MESPVSAHTTASSPCIQSNTSPLTPAAFVQPTCLLKELPTFARNVSNARPPQPSQSLEVGKQTTPLATSITHRYETHLMLTPGIVIGIYLLLRLVFAAVRRVPPARDRVEDLANEQLHVDWEQQGPVDSPRSSNAGDEQRPDGPFDDPLTRYAALRRPAVLVTHRPHHVVLEVTAGTIRSESEGTAYECLIDQRPDDPDWTSSASTTLSDASGSPVFSLPSAYSQDSIPTGEDTVVTTPDEHPRPLELPQDDMMRELVLNVACILSSLRNDPPSPLSSASGTPHLTTTANDAEVEPVRAMICEPQDSDVVLAYLRHRRTHQASDDLKAAGTKGEDENLPQFEAALARIRSRRAELVPEADVVMDEEKPDISAVRHMSQCFIESVATGTAPYGKGTKEEIWRWLGEEERERRVARRSVRRDSLCVGRKPDLVSASELVMKSLTDVWQGEILAMHTGLRGFLYLLTSGAGQLHQPQVDYNEKREDTAVAGEACFDDWTADDIVVPDDRDVANKVERGGLTIRNSRRPARGGKVRALARHTYHPWDGHTEVFLKSYDLPSLGDVTAVVHDTMQEDVAYETEFRHAPRLLEKIEDERRRAALKTRAMQYARMSDERGRPLAGSSRVDATIVNETTEYDTNPVAESHSALLSPSKVASGGESAIPRQHEEFFERDGPVADGSQMDVPPSPPMEAEEIEQLRVLAMLRASRLKRRR